MDYESSQMVGLFYFVGFTRYLIMLRTWVRGNPESVAKRISRTPAIFRGKRKRFSSRFSPKPIVRWKVHHLNHLFDNLWSYWMVRNGRLGSVEPLAFTSWQLRKNLHRKLRFYKGCPVCPGEFSAKMWNWLKLTIPLLSHRTHSTFTTKLSTSNCVLTQW